MAKTETKIVSAKPAKAKMASSAKALKARADRLKKAKKLEEQALRLGEHYRNPGIIKGEDLNAQQIEFCTYFTSHDGELFGNGARCYLAVYGEAYFRKHQERMEFSVAVSAASRLLTNVKVIDYVNKLLEDAGLNDSHVDKQLLLVINQNGDFRAKIAGIKEYNNLRKRVDSRPVTIVGNNITFQKFEK